MTIAYLGLGSNQGDREALLSAARQAIRLSFPGARFSPLYETEPVGVRDQPWFLNQAAEIDTFLPPQGLLEWCLDLEKRNGRARTTPQGPRTLDVDVLLFGNEVLDEEHLTVPHPRMMERRFVLLPLSDLAPEMEIPGTGKTVGDALRNLRGSQAVKPYEGRRTTC